MARITGQTDEQIFRIQKWLGLNENPDGDTKLKLGEAAVMRNRSARHSIWAVGTYCRELLWQG